MATSPTRPLYYGYGSMAACPYQAHYTSMVIIIVDNLVTLLEMLVGVVDSFDYYPYQALYLYVNYSSLILPYTIRYLSAFNPFSTKKCFHLKS